MKNDLGYLLELQILCYITDLTITSPTGKKVAGRMEREACGRALVRGVQLLQFHCSEIFLHKIICIMI